MSKIKILFVPSDLAGVGHFRTIWPAQQIQKDFPDDFQIEINAAPNTQNLDYMKSFDIIHFHRHLGPTEGEDKLFAELKKSGTKLLMDIDDYWDPPKTHPLYGAAQQEGIPKKIVHTFGLADYVTTTTDIFAKYISKYNRNVVIMPNAIDPDHKMWVGDNVPKSDKLRISWIGGSSHLNDLVPVSESMRLLHNDESLKGKYQMVMCGFDIRGHITEIRPDGSQTTRKIEPHETVWNRFEEIFTGNFKCVGDEYKAWLKKYKNEPYPFGDLSKETYVRRWTLPLTQYGRHYSYCDVCTAPLADNVFNEVKSELKIIESGMKKKVLIAQDFGIYRELIKDGENGFLIPKKANDSMWYEKIKMLINDPSLVEKLSTNLHNMVKDKYHLKNASKERAAFYKSLIKTNSEVNENVLQEIK